MGITRLVTYKPKSTLETVARALILRTFREAANDKTGSLPAALAVVQEISDRVEGAVVRSAPVAAVGLNVNALDVQVNFGPRGAEVQTEQLEPVQETEIVNTRRGTE
jgi:hypothetical protein